MFQSRYQPAPIADKFRGARFVKATPTPKRWRVVYDARLVSVAASDVGASEAAVAVGGAAVIERTMVVSGVTVAERTAVVASAAVIERTMVVNGVTVAERTAAVGGAAVTERVVAVVVFCGVAIIDGVWLAMVGLFGITLGTSRSMRIRSMILVGVSVATISVD